MFGFYCIAFIEYMLSGQTLLDYTNLSSPTDYKKNDKIIYKYFKDKTVLFVARKNWLLLKIKNSIKICFNKI